MWRITTAISHLGIVVLAGLERRCDEVNVLDSESLGGSKDSAVIVHVRALFNHADQAGGALLEDGFGLAEDAKILAG